MHSICRTVARLRLTSAGFAKGFAFCKTGRCTKSRRAEYIRKASGRCAAARRDCGASRKYTHFFIADKNAAC